MVGLEPTTLRYCHHVDY